MKIVKDGKTPAPFGSLTGSSRYASSDDVSNNPFYSVVMKMCIKKLQITVKSVEGGILRPPESEDTVV